MSDCTSISRFTRTTVCAFSLLGVAALGACGHDSTSATATSPPTSAETDQATETPAAEPNLLTVTAHDEGDKGGQTMSFDVAGTPRAGLVDIRFANAGLDTHELSFMRLKPGVSLGDVTAAMQKDEGAAMDLMIDPDTELPGPSMLGPGATVDVHTDLVAGHYMAICFLPGHDQQPHFAMGMINEFTVSEDASPSTVPTTDGTITLSDEAISLPDGFAAEGGGTVEVTNTGTRAHDLSFARLDDTTLPDFFQCVGTAFEKGKPVDNCPGTLMGGVSSVSPGQSEYLTIELPPGEYGYVSTADKDFQAGLNGVFTVD